MEIPTTQELLSAVNSGNYLTMTIRGHQLLETLLQKGVSEALTRPHAVELARLSFGLKIDLAVALDVIPFESRASYVSINRIRNRFAHQSTAQFVEQDAQDLYNVLSPHQRYLLKKTPAELPQPEEMLGFVMAVLFVELESALSRLRDQKLMAEVLHEMTQEVVGGKTPPKAISAKVNDDIRERLKRKRGDPQ